MDVPILNMDFFFSFFELFQIEKYFKNVFFKVNKPPW